MADEESQAHPSGLKRNSQEVGTNKIVEGKKVRRSNHDDSSEMNQHVDCVPPKPQVLSKKEVEDQQTKQINSGTITGIALACASSTGPPQPEPEEKVDEDTSDTETITDDDLDLDNSLETMETDCRAKVQTWLNNNDFDVRDSDLYTSEDESENDSSQDSSTISQN